MFKRFSFLISLVLLLCLAGSVRAQVEVTWDNNDGAGDQLWDTASNWDVGVPTSVDIAVIDDYSDDGNGPIIQAGIDAVAAYVEMGYYISPPGGVESVLTMTGGTLTVDGWIDPGGYYSGNYRFDLSGGTVTVTGLEESPQEGTWTGIFVGFNQDSIGVMDMNAGDVNVVGGLWLGFEPNSQGIFNMTGGTYTGYYIYIGDFEDWGGGGVMNLHGGTIHCSDFSMGEVSHLNISDGVLTCDTDLTVANGWIFDPSKDNPVTGPMDGVRGDAPGYSGTLPTLVAWGTVTAYDVDSGDIITDSVNYPSEAGLRALVKIDYDVTNADMTTVSAAAVDPNLAYNPSPFDKSRSVQPAEFSLISWSAGTTAAQHHVYFGTSFAEVNSADSTDTTGIYKGPQALADTNYAPTLEYVFARDYFWRIDEVNSAGGVQWPGSVWSFTADDHAVVDDFDSYVNQTALWNIWDDYTTNSTGAAIYVEKDVNFVRDGNSLKYWYDSTISVKGTCVGSIASTDTTRLGIGSDWTISGVEALVLWFRGEADNNPNSTSQLYLQLEDTDANSGVVLYDDMNDLLEESWSEWNIDLAIFDACGVDLTNIDKIHIGFGGEIAGGDCSTKTGGEGYVWFEDIELWPARCRTEVIATDFTGDCVTDGLDLAVIAADWLESDGLVVSAPPSYDPDIWFKFDEGAGQVTTNSGLMGTDYNGQLGNTSGVDACDPTWITTDPCADRLKCLDFDGTDDYVQVPDINLNSNTVTITAWIKRNGAQAANAGIVTSREGTSPESLNFRETTHELGYTWNDDDGATWGFESGLFIQDGQWTFAALVVEPEQATLYKSDGTTYSSKTNAIAHIAQTFDGFTTIGKDAADWEARNVTGRIDDVRIYNKSLRIGEVLGLAGLSVSFYDPLEEPTNLVVRVPDPAADPNYYPSNPDIINFADFDVLADKWLEGPTLWP